MKKLFLLMFAMALLATAGTVKAAVYYVDTTGVEGDNLIATVAQARANPQIDTIYVAIGLYKMNTELIVEDVIIGGCTFDGSGGFTRQYPGAVGNDRNKMTILDGNSFVLSLPSQKHRVATINKGGVIDGCLIRNGHARGTTNNPNDTKGFGGGVLINTGGKLHNSIVRGNVAMNLQFSKTNPSYGGGVYVNDGDVANCIIAFNLDDMGLGIGGSSGTILNNTIARNANAPRFVLIPGTIDGSPFRHYSMFGLAGAVPPYIHLDSFYMAATETTQGQYACFLAAVELTENRYNHYITATDWIAMCAAMTPMYGYSGISISKYLGIHIAEINNPTRFIINQSTAQVLGMAGTISGGNEVFYPLKAALAKYEANTDGSSNPNVSNPADPLVRENFPMAFVGWNGGVAFSVWIGGMLPTEAQWEYAARKKADGSIYNDGSYAGGYTDANGVGWSKSNANKTTHEVATLQPTELGLYDMNGNVDEWCADWMYYTEIYPIAVSIAPTGTAELGHYMSTIGGVTGSTIEQAFYNPIHNSPNQMRIVRGGSYANETATFALGYRSGYHGPEGLINDLGFRVAACAGL